MTEEIHSKEIEVELYKEKEIAFYSASLNAWYTTKFEKDRFLLNLSVAAIGLMITLITTVGITTEPELIAYSVAFLFFLLNIVMALKVFDLNARYLEKLVNNEDTGEIKLKKYDFAMNFCFLNGLALAVTAALFSALVKLGGW